MIGYESGSSLRWAARAGLGLSLTFLLGCPQDVSVSLAEDVEAEAVTFLISDYSGEAATGRISRFEVWRRTWVNGEARTTVVWSIHWPGWRTTRISDVRYGVVPAGFVEEFRAAPLETGRYFATAGGHGLDFEVLSNGSVLASADVEGRYAVAGLRDEDVAELVEQLQKAMGERDSVLVAALTHFPLRYNSNGQSELIENEAAFFAAFDSVFTPAVASAILGADPLGLSASYRGVMFGSGALWIGGVCGETPATGCPPAIVAINGS